MQRLTSFAKYPWYKTCCPIPGCNKVFMLPHDQSLETFIKAADITGRQCEMHLLYHKALGHLGEPPTRPLPAQAVLEPVATAPLPPPRLDADQPPSTDLPDTSTTDSPISPIFHPSTKGHRGRARGKSLKASKKRRWTDQGRTRGGV